MEEKAVLSKVFHIDGSLRDIYVNEPTTIDDWNEVWKFFRSLSNFTLTIDGEKVNEMPSEVTVIFNERQEKAIYLNIDYNGIEFICHFFSEEEIELDISPAAIKDITDVNSVIDFMEILAKLLGKKCQFQLKTINKAPS